MFGLPEQMFNERSAPAPRPSHHFRYAPEAPAGTTHNLHNGCPRGLDHFYISTLYTYDNKNILRIYLLTYENFHTRLKRIASNLNLD